MKVFRLCMVLAFALAAIPLSLPRTTVRAADAPAAAAPVPFISAKTLLIVRHGDDQKGVKKTKGAQAPLSIPGVARAADLNEALKDFGITIIVASDTTRTQQTVQKLAATLNLKVDISLHHGAETADPAATPTIAPAADKDAAADKEATAAIAHLAAVAHPNDVILLAYHHNVIPLILAHLGFKDEPPIASGEFDRLYVLTPDAAHHTYHLLRLRYGQKEYDGDKSVEGKP